MVSKNPVMVSVNPVPKENTSYQLLIALVPDIEERINKLKSEHPEFLEEIRRRAVETAEGWRPLQFWQGAF